jgi:CDP-glucose 4,6-dehydratase
LDGSIMMSQSFWRGRRIFLTGHTGFKGGWLALWLSSLGAEVHGFAHPPSTDPCFFVEAGVAEVLASSTIGDVRDKEDLLRAVQSCNPEIVFHLAAQALVRRSYAEPAETFATNVMGTVNLLEALRSAPALKAIVNVTTDKCYENREWVWGYRENEPLGGRDPYSSSKACAELVSFAYRSSFFSHKRIGLATARAGNVIGGGDWSEDRLLPDFFRAWDAGQPVLIRAPRAVRPWQHVLEPLCGYLTLAEALYSSEGDFSEPWNFGPTEDDTREVGWLASHFALRTGCGWKLDDANQPHEATFLKLDSSKARSRLRWFPRWSLEAALDRTIDWHSEWRNGHNMHVYTLGQISDYDRSKREV